jgi:preprotein translocase subunit SecG
MIIAVTVVHVLVCVFLVVVVLLQHGKSADIAAAFGGMGSQTAFGPRGTATLLSKATTVAAVVFLLTSISLTVLYTKQRPGTGSVLEGEKPAATETQPAQPTEQPAQQPAQQPAAPQQ